MSLGGRGQRGGDVGEWHGGGGWRRWLVVIDGGCDSLGFGFEKIWLF